MMNRSVVLVLVAVALALGGISNARASSSHRVFTAQSEWHKSGNFDEIDTDAVSFDAIESAYKKCRDAGFDLCVLKNVLQSNVETKDDGLRYVEYSAVVSAVDGLTSLRSGKIFKKTGRVSSSQPLQTLTNLGAKSAALGSALEACYQAGYSVCAIVALDYQSVNDTSLNDGRYTTVARASVKGLSLAGDVLQPSNGMANEMATAMEESEVSDLLPRIDLNLL